MKPEDELRDVFRSQALQAPDPLAVRARIDRAVDRRRRRHQVVAVASATFAVGGIGLGVQALKPTGHRVVETGVAPTAEPMRSSSQRTSPLALGSAPASASPSPVTSATPVPSRLPVAGTPNDALDAFFAANYQYDDAVTLSQLWQTDPYTAKAIGGQILRDGGNLPVNPGQSAPARPTTQTALASKDTQRFFAAGYTQTQAAQLVTLWQEPDVNLVIVVAGQQLSDGVTLPIAP